MAEPPPSLLQRVQRELAVCRLVLRDPRTPWYARAMFGLAVAYLLSPIDLIPDFIPVIGHLDDLVIVPALVRLAFRMIPVEVLAEHRHAVETAGEPH